MLESGGNTLLNKSVNCFSISSEEPSSGAPIKTIPTLFLLTNNSFSSSYATYGKNLDSAGLLIAAITFCKSLLSKNSCDGWLRPNQPFNDLLENTRAPLCNISFSKTTPFAPPNYFFLILHAHIVLLYNHPGYSHMAPPKFLRWYLVFFELPHDVNH